jgi:hypothetical protein
MRRLIVFLVLIGLVKSALSQQIFIRGKIKEQGTGLPLPFVSISKKNNTAVTFSDMDGRFSLGVSASDTVIIRFLGYNTLRLPANYFSSDSLVMLKPSVTQLHEFVIDAGVNPAHLIIRRASSNKEKFDVPDTAIMQYTSYTKNQVDVSNLRPKFRERKLIKKILRSYDRLAKAEQTEVPNLPLYLSENTAWVQATGGLTNIKEKVNGIHINFIGKDQADLAAQLSGSDYQSYNFNRNNVMVFRKAFLSPLATNALLFYDYRLIDTVQINGRDHFRIMAIPRNTSDLLFNGMLWIEDSTYALTRCDLEISSSVNLNFVNRFHITQELLPLQGNIRVVGRMNLFTEVVNLKKDWFNMLLHTTVINSEHTLVSDTNKQQIPRKAFDEMALKQAPEWWEQKRPIPLNNAEAESFALIDTLSALPLLKGSFKTIYALATGYIPAGWFEFGSLQSFYASNAIEGDRIKLQVRTSRFFSNRFIFRTYAAYGTRDRAWKYNLQGEYVFSRVPWIKCGIQKREDNDQFGVNYNYSRSPAINSSRGSLYSVSAQIGSVNRLNRNREWRIWFDAEPLPGLQTRLVFQRIQSTPLFTLGDEQNVTTSFFRIPAITSEMRVEGRWHPGESFIQFGNERISLGNIRTPTISFVYTKAFKGILGSSISYQKLWINVRYRINLGILGFSEPALTMAKIFGSVPYSILEIHRGNETPFYSSGVFNTMQFFEFVSDQFVTLSLNHNFQGILLNRLPLIKKLRWRELITFNAVYGNLSKGNKIYQETSEFTTLSQRPFMEAGFGIDNILKFIRLDFLWRLNYLDQNYLDTYAKFYRTSNPARFAMKFSFAFGL